MIGFRGLLFSLFLSALVAVPALAGAVDIYVAPQGNDSNPGTKGAPLATVTKARDVIRGLKESGRTDAQITVHLRQGTYFLKDTLAFGPKDSGSKERPVVYRAYPGEQPTLSGGVRIRGWKEWENGIYVASVGDRDFRQLYVNGQKAVRARFPDAGDYLRLVDWTKDKRIKMRREDVPQSGVPTGSEMVVKKHWNQSRYRVASFSSDDGFAWITPAEPMRTLDWRQPCPQRSSDQVCHFENAIGFLDAAGEWHWDRNSRKLYYKPREGETMTTAEVIIPVLEQLLRIEGAKHIRFVGLQFEHTTWLGANYGYLGLQSNIHTPTGPGTDRKRLTIPPGIVLVAAGHVRFEGNIFRNMGGSAIGLEYGTFHNHFVGNVVRDIAGNGFTVYSDISRVNPTDDQLCREDVIRDNYIADCGTEYYGSSGIAAFYCDGLLVEHNEIYALPYNGMHLHWYNGKQMNTTIRGNHIHDVMQFCDDGGAIHMVAAIPNTRIARNYLHSIRVRKWCGKWGISNVYHDNSTSGVTVEQNVLENGNRQIAYRNKTSPSPPHNMRKDNHYEHGTLPEAVIEKIKAEAGPRDGFAHMRKSAPESNTWAPLEHLPEPKGSMAALACGGALAAESKIVWLDELDVSLSTCGWGQTQANKSVGGNKLTIAGTTYARGIGTHAPGEFRIRLDGGTERFTALVGIDGESGGAGSAEFKVAADGRIVWESGVMRGGAAAKPVDVKLDGVKTLRLIVTVAGDNYNNDHADWVNAGLEVSGKEPRAVKASQTGVGLPAAAGPDTAGVSPSLCGPEAVAGPAPDVLRADWEEEYARVARLNPRGYKFPASQVYNPQAMAQASDKSPVDAGIRRLEALLEKLSGMSGAPKLDDVRAKLAEIKGKAADGKGGLDLYLELREVTRKAVLANPLLDFDSILFVSRGVLNDHQPRKSEYDGDHFCDQYYGHNGRKGGGLFILKNWKSADARVVDVVAGLKVPGGTNEGMPLSEGTFLSPDLFYDGRTIVFAWSSGGTEKWDPATRFSIFKVGSDGSGLTRLTDDGRFDDFDPCWLPNGRIVFMSTRRGGFGRCHGRPVPSYTMFSMKDDGSDLIPISCHETNEFHPSVDNNGMIVYTRWDYVDRDHSAAHHMWHCYPDGRDPRSYHGNYALPLMTGEGGGFPHGLHMRPWAEFNCRGIPGSDKYVATAGPHHGQAFGSLVVIDIKVPDDNKMSQVKRLTPDSRFPESECGTRNRSDMAYGTAWPLSESFYVCNYKDRICVIDEFGNREFVCRVENGLRPLDPIPVRPRKRPPVIPCKTRQGERASTDAPPAAIGVMDVRISERFGRLPEGADIRQLRVVQLLPKSTVYVNNPRIGFGDQSLARIPLGVAPVEKDGSVYFKAPVGKAIYFQLLDENGMAVKSMRSATYVHPGEQLTCLGCHEDKLDAPPLPSGPLAMRRAPSELEPEVENDVMFNFGDHVKPVLQSKCVECHKARPNSGPTNMGYDALNKYAFYLGHGYRNPLHGGTRTAPGKFGALASRMGKALLNPTHRKALDEGKFSKEDFRKIVMWLDLNSNQYSVYQNWREQGKGEVLWPALDVDPRNYRGMEKETPAP